MIMKVKPEKSGGEIGISGSKPGNHHPEIPSKEWIHIPPNGKLGKSSTQNAYFLGDMFFFPGGYIEEETLEMSSNMKKSEEDP